MADLLDVLRETGSKLLETEKPVVDELASVVGALVAHLEAKLPAVADVAIADIAHKLEPQAVAAAEAAGQTSTAHVPQEPTPEAPGEGQGEASRIAQLEAELATARATAPTVSTAPIQSTPAA